MDESPPKVVLEFTGLVSFNTISCLLPKLKENVDALGEKVNTYKRLLTISIEILENCYRYIENKLDLKDYQENYPSYIKIHKKGNDFVVESGNTILKEDVLIITNKLEKVNSLDESGLRELYKKTIANGQFSEVGGAGLGFIEIAKASGGKIDYSFECLQQDVYFYKIKLDVKP
jgi:Tfp pilus assembly protein PilZ